MLSLSQSTIYDRSDYNTSYYHINGDVSLGPSGLRYLSNNRELYLPLLYEDSRHIIPLSDRIMDYDDPISRISCNRCPYNLKNESDEYASLSCINGACYK